LEQTIEDPVPDGAGIAHVSQGETKRFPQTKDCSWREQTARLHFQGRCKFATEAVLLSCIIDAKEGMDVAVIYIPNAFIQMRVEDEGDMAIIKIRGVLVDILVQIAPDVYKSYVTTDKKGTKQLLVQCQNALYGTMVASLLYYRKFTKSLTSVRSEINPYDPCVANKIVDGTQMTI
jgi:hypothetical protein